MSNELNTWEKIIDPDHLGSELIGSVGAEKVVTIKDIGMSECYDEKLQKKVNKVTLFLEETKPLVLNKTNARTLKKLFSPDSDTPEACIGHQIKLVVESVKAFGKVVDAIRIKEYTEQKCEECGAVLKPASGKTVAELIEISKRNTNKILCVKCMQEYKKKQEGEQSK